MVGLYYPSFLFLLPALALAVFAQWRVRSTVAKYSRIPIARGMSARSAAQTLLDAQGVSGVTIERAQRTLGDHYDPRKKILRLSNPDSASVASVGIAAHEVGHAIQHARGFGPLALRTAIVPIARPTLCAY